VNPDAVSSAGAPPRAPDDAPDAHARAPIEPPAAPGRHWADLAVGPLVLAIFGASLLWFARNHRVFVDDGLYLLEGLNLLEGRGVSIFGDQQETIRGPVFPFMVGIVSLVFDRDVGAIGMVLRALAVVNPILLYLLIRRLAGPVAGLLAAALGAAFSYTAVLTQTLNVDAVMAGLLLAAILLLVVSIDRRDLRLAAASGAALALAILTKETALALLPMGLVAGGLLGWPARGVGWHYAGLAAVCLPWWLYVLASTGEVYLVGQLSTALAAAAAAGALLLGVAGLVLWRRGTAAAALARSERGRALAAWAVVGLWVVVLTGLLLSTTAEASELTLGSAESYVRKRVLPATPVWYLLGPAFLYVVVRAVQRHRLWSFYLALILMQIPVCVLLFALRYTLARQFLVVQILLYGALAALVATLLYAALERRPWASSRALAAVAAALIAVLVVPTALGRGRYFVTYDRGELEGGNPDNQLNRAARDMSDYMERNVPEGEGVISTWHYSYQVAYQTGLDQRWEQLDLDCPEEPRSLVATACGTGSEIWTDTPARTVWFRLDGECTAAAMSLGTVLAQLERTDSDYLLLTSDRRHPGLFDSAPQLAASGAFEVVHFSPLEGDVTSDNGQGLVLLRRTGRPPGPAPAFMTAATVGHAIKCSRAENGGDGYVERLRSTFPDGVVISGEKPIARFYRVRAEQIFSSVS